MATQHTLALFENIEPVQQKINFVTDMSVKPPVCELSKATDIILPKECPIELPRLSPPDFKSQIVDVQV